MRIYLSLYNLCRFYVCARLWHILFIMYFTCLFIYIFNFSRTTMQSWKIKNKIFSGAHIASSSSGTYPISNIDDYSSNVHPLVAMRNNSDEQLPNYVLRFWSHDILLLPISFFLNIFPCRLKYRIYSFISHDVSQVLELFNFNGINNLGVFVHLSKIFDVYNLVSSRYL